MYLGKSIKIIDNTKKAQANAEEAHKLIDIRKVPMDVDRFGTVPLDPVASGYGKRLSVSPACCRKRRKGCNRKRL